MLENGIFANGFRQHIESIDAGHPEVDASLADASRHLQQLFRIPVRQLFPIHRRERYLLEKFAAASFGAYG